MLCFYFLPLAAFVFASPFPYDSNDLTDFSTESAEIPDNSILADATDTTVAEIGCTSDTSAGNTSDGDGPEEGSSAIDRRQTMCPSDIAKKKKVIPSPERLGPANQAPTTTSNAKCPSASMPYYVTCGGPELALTEGISDLKSDIVINCLAGKFLPIKKKKQSVSNHPNFQFI